MPIASSRLFASRSPSWSAELSQTAAPAAAATAAAVAVTDAGHDRRQAPRRVLAELAGQHAQLQPRGRWRLRDTRSRRATAAGTRTTSFVRGRTARLREGRPAVGAAEDHGVRQPLRLEVRAADREQVADAHAHRRDAGDAGLGRRRRERGGSATSEHGGDREQAGDENDDACLYPYRRSSGRLNLSVAAAGHGHEVGEERRARSGAPRVGAPTRGARPLGAAGGGRRRPPAPSGSRRSAGCTSRRRRS